MTAMAKQTKERERFMISPPSAITKHSSTSPVTPPSPSGVAGQEDEHEKALSAACASSSDAMNDLRREERLYAIIESDAEDVRGGGDGSFIENELSDEFSLALNVVSDDETCDDAASSPTTTTRGAIDGGHRPARKRARNGGGDAGRRRRTAATRDDVTARPWSLDVLVGSVAAVDRAIRVAEDDVVVARGGKSMSSYTSLGFVLGSHGAARIVGGTKNNLVRRSLPGRPAGTRDELEEWNATSWPTLFFEERTTRYREDMSALTYEEARAMAAGMAEAVEDALEGRRQRGGWL